MRPNWDVYLVNALSLCPSEKAVLTSYPLGYELPNKVPKEDVELTMLCADYFDEDGMLRIKGKRLSASGSSTAAGRKKRKKRKKMSPPRPSLFWASGFSFSRSQLLKEVPYDNDIPHLFFGEEISMALRMFTHGWDTFTPSDAVVYHLWDRSYRPTVREHFSEAKQREKLRSQQKVRSLLGMEGMEEDDKKKTKNYASAEIYGLGSSRSLEEFEEHCGVSFKNRVVHSRGARGGQPEGSYRDDSTSSAAQVMKLLQMKGLLSGF
jgi:[Skp1-protein]-hydroxyproline N-acetylglucosaminyltransferase